MSKIVKLITSNCGKITADSVDEYVSNGGFEGLKKSY
jgi:NADH-quinone oxidoreductase subunit F